MTQTPDLFTVTVKLFGSLGLILLIVLVIFYAFRHFVHHNNLGSRNNLIQILETRYLGGKKSIAILKVPSAFLVVGLSSDQINLLANIDEEKVSHAAASNTNYSEKPSFLTVLSKFSAKTKDPGGRHV